MKKYIFTLCIAILAGALNSCILDDDAPVNNGATGQLTLKYTVEGKNITTYATVAPTQGEDVVKSLYLLFFDASGNYSGKFVEAIKIPGTPSMNTTIPITLAPGSAISATGAYNVLAVANLTENRYLFSNDINSWCAQLVGKTEKEVMEQSVAFTVAEEPVAPDQLLMQGRTSKPANDGAISIVLTRNFARFDVSNNKKQDFDLVTTSVWNAYPQSLIFGKGLLDYSASTVRLKKFYGITNPNVDGGIYQDIKGGLYAFENEVVSPGKNDNLTTCLIVGLRDRSKGASAPLTYYRINIRPQNSPQILKRNNVYRVTITNVFGPGANTEEEAYSGIGADLDYTINYWDLDDNGLIVQDGSNILAVPTKNVRIDAEGGQFSYSIYTFSSSGTPASPLQIKSQTWEPQTSDIHATLTGNTLVITATKLSPYMPDRNGVIILSYAGLEASIAVTQSNAVNTFLEVVLPGGGIPTFGASPGIYTGEIEVRASGAWTAELFGEKGFSFADGNSAAVEKINYNPPSVVSPQIRSDKYFKIWTHTLNNSSDIRKAFVIVSLDSDPANFVSVITLTQNPQGKLSVGPTIRKFTAANYATKQRVTVDGTTSLGNKEWTAVILPTSANADKFTLSSTEGNGVGSQRTFDIGTVGQNTSGSLYSAIIRVSLKQETTAFTDITVTQESAGFTLATKPGTGSVTTPIAKTGGTSPVFVVETDASFKWSAKVTMSATPTTGGTTIVNHTARIYDASSGNLIPDGTVRPVSDNFLLVFPKVYWPNREIHGITATVTVTLHDANGDPTPLTRTVNISQNPLISAGTVASNMQIHSGAGGNTGGGDWGSLYCTVYDPNYVTAVINNFTRINGAPDIKTTTYLHAYTYELRDSPTPAPGWAKIDNFRTQKDAITVVSMVGGSISQMNLAGTTMPKLGFSIAAPGPTSNISGRLDTSSADKKLYKILVTKGRYTISSPSTLTFFMDGNSTAANKLPPTAVPIIKNVNNGHCVLAIDASLKIIYIGEAQVLGSNDGWSANPGRQALLNNLMFYIRNAAAYGSHFTDLLNDNLSNVPDIWDPVWGSNAAYM
jgi:hypothetical protein